MNTKLMMIGDGELRSNIQEKVNSLGIANSVIFTGLQRNVNELLQGIDCFVFPSFYEGLPVTIIEAQASGLPIVLSDVISKEVEITPLLTWMSIAEKETVWAEKCYEKAVNMLNGRTNYLSLVKCSGYDIAETSKELCDFYLKHVMTQ